MPAFIDISGHRYNRWTVLRRIGGSLWLCRCVCGNERPVLRGHLRNGASHSCGCYQKERAAETQHVHGASRGRFTPEYRAWTAMKTRCTNAASFGYRWYGARGVTVCDRWLHSFENFLHDVGFRPAPHFSIDRINVNGHYEPSNVRWATPLQQRLNQRPRGSGSTVAILQPVAPSTPPV